MSDRKRGARSELKYVGPGPDVSALPLPEGWPAEDHDEPNAAVRAEKLASGMYAEAEE